MDHDLTTGMRKSSRLAGCQTSRVDAGLVAILVLLIFATAGATPNNILPGALTIILAAARIYGVRHCEAVHDKSAAAWTLGTWTSVLGLITLWNWFCLATLLDTPTPLFMTLVLSGTLLVIHGHVTSYGTEPGLIFGILIVGLTPLGFFISEEYGAATTTPYILALGLYLYAQSRSSSKGRWHTTVFAEQLKLRTDELNDAIMTADALREVAEQRALATGDFVARTSHELRTPLNNLIGQTELLLAGTLPDNAQHRIRRMSTSLDILLKLVNDLLTYLQCQSGSVQLEFRPTDIRKTVREVADTFSAVAQGSSIELDVQIADGVPGAVDIDELRLVQILNNLVGNAMKFSKNGAVTIRVELHGGDDELVFSVEDSGPGIPAAKIPDAFKPFTRIRESSGGVGGTGLGLAITHSLATLLGGRVGIDSEVGVGTTAWFAVPVRETSQEVQPRSTRRATMKTVGTAARQRVLHLDDNPANVEILQSQLEHLGHIATGTTSASDAIELVQQEYFDVVLVDCQMPEMTGYDFTRKIRQLPGPSKHVPILAVTADASPAATEEATASGMDDVLIKPLRIRDLSNAIDLWASESTGIRIPSWLCATANPAPFFAALDSSLAMNDDSANEALDRLLAVAKGFGLTSGAAKIRDIQSRDCDPSNSDIQTVRQLLSDDIRNLAMTMRHPYPVGDRDE